MTNDATRATSTVLPEINRRRMLVGAAVAPACGLAAMVPAASLASHAPDPMLEAINAYRAAVAAFRAIPIDQITMENEDALVEATYGPAQDAILVNEPHTPKVTSLEGVREAIRLTFEEKALIDCIASNALRSALAYLDREAI